MEHQVINGSLRVKGRILRIDETAPETFRQILHQAMPDLARYNSNQSSASPVFLIYSGNRAKTLSAEGLRFFRRAGVGFSDFTRVHIQADLYPYWDVIKMAGYTPILGCGFNNKLTGYFLSI